MTLESIVVGFLIFAAIYLTLIGTLMVTGRGALAREVATLLPNLVLLFRGLAGDTRVPRRAKLALTIAAVWIASPVDLVPEFIPIPDRWMTRSWRQSCCDMCSGRRNRPWSKSTGVVIPRLSGG